MRFGQGLEEFGEGSVVGLEELEGFGDAGHGSSGWFYDVLELLQRAKFVLQESFTVSIDFLLQFFIFNALNHEFFTRSYYCFWSFFLSFLGASVDI